MKPQEAIEVDHPMRDAEAEAEYEAGESEQDVYAVIEWVMTGKESDDLDAYNARKAQRRAVVMASYAEQTGAGYF